jgi:hypothetical protein
MGFHAVTSRNALMSDTKHAELVAWLKEQGHTPAEIEKVMAKVADYDAQTVRESIFDSINSGAVDIAEFVREALSKK